MNVEFDNAEIQFRIQTGQTVIQSLNETEKRGWVKVDITIIEASMSYSEENGYVGSVAFTVEGHPAPYEVALQSKKGKDWAYSLLFQRGSGKEEDILAVEESLEEDDELFERLVDAAMKAYREA